MNALANGNTPGSKTVTKEKGRVSAQVRECSRNISEILLSEPQTSGHINKKGILIYDNDMLMLFGKIADKRSGCLRRDTAEIIPSTRLKDEITDGINEDIRRGWGDNIHHIKVSPETVKWLFIEGVIAPEILRAAHVIDGVVILPGVGFETTNGLLKLPILCSTEFEFECATVDNKGRIIA